MLSTVLHGLNVLNCIAIRKPWPENESLEGRVDLGTSSQVMAFVSQCSSKHLGHAEALIACSCTPRQEREDKQ